MNHTHVIRSRKLEQWAGHRLDGNMSPTPQPATAPTAGSFEPLSPTRRVRWGIMATGGIAGTWADALRQLPDECELVAVGSRTQASADEFAAKYQVPQAFGSYEELASCPDIDVVYVASPHSHHLEHSLLAINAGKHVLVEKSMTPSQADTVAIFEAAERAKVFAMEAVWTRCNPIIRQAQALISRGMLGDVRLVRASFSFKFDGDDEHRLWNPELAGGAVLDLGVYPAHITHSMVGCPQTVRARGTLGRTGVDATSVASLSWPNNATLAELYCSLEAGAETRLEVVGTDARLEIPFFLRPDKMTLTPANGEPQEFVTQLPPGGYTFQAQEVHQCLRQGNMESSLVPWQSSVDVAWVMDCWLNDLHQESGN